MTITQRNRRAVKHELQRKALSLLEGTPWAKQARQGQLKAGAKTLADGVLGRRRNRA